MNTKNHASNFNHSINTNTINTNTDANVNINNYEINNRNNTKNSNSKLIRNYEKELINNEKNEFEVSMSNNLIYDTDAQDKTNLNNVKTGHFMRLENKNIQNDNNDPGKKSNDLLLNSNEKEDESINIIKNQIRSNLTFLNLLQQHKKEANTKGTFEDEEQEEFFNKNRDQKYNNNEIISEKNEYEGIEFKITEEEKYAKILMKQETKLEEKSVDEIDKEIKNLEAKKKKILERKNTDNIASSFNFRNKVLPNIHISNMFLKDKTSSKKHYKIDKINLLRSNTNKFVNSSSNSNSKQNSVNGADEAFSLKSFKFARQKTKSGKHLRPDKFGYNKQNSHFSYKSSSSNKNSVFTFHNHAQMRDRESIDIGNSLLESIPEFSKISANYQRGITNMFFNNSFINQNNFITSGHLNEDLNTNAYKITLENMNGDFFASDKILIDPNGLNILNSINKDGSFYFGTKLKDVNSKIINDYLINPNKEIQSESCFKIFFDQTINKVFFKLLTKDSENLILYKKIDAKYVLKDKNFLYLGSYLISMEISFETINAKKESEKDGLKNKNTVRGKIKESKTNTSEQKGKVLKINIFTTNQTINSKNNSAFNSTFNSTDISILTNTKANKTDSFSFTPSESPITIGRTKCNINLTDSFLSKLHCRIQYTSDNSWLLLDGAEDKPSKNGTWLLIENEFTLEGMSIFKNGSSIFKVTVTE